MLRHSGVFLLLAGVVLSLCAWTDPAFTGGDDASVRVDAHAYDEMKAATTPSLTAQSALLMDADSRQILWSFRPNERRAPASLTKMMTALLVRSYDPLDRVVVISPEAAATPGSRMGLQAGEQFTVLQLLYGLLLPSGNDAAVALAEATSGTSQRFVALMNQRAAIWGLTGTHFENPHGLDAPGHYSTAVDLARLGDAVLRDPVLSGIVRTQEHTAVAVRGASIPLHNLNELLGTYTGTIGIKTGTTAAAGEDLVAAVDRDGHTVIAVILGSQERYVDARALLNYGWSNWEWPSADLPELAEIDNGAITLVPVHVRTVPVPRWAADQVTLHWSIDPQEAARSSALHPVLAGMVEWRLGGVTVGRADLEAVR
ncbi:MAG: D-alanyl-D-alanine carboxypeptidase [Chloroflexi bacterium]|nr:D-alanyl-D-alanine carboxypeptidase [Chloroflexota bacterium]